MEGRVLWYKPIDRTGCLVTDRGDHVSFMAGDDDTGIHGGARLAFRLTKIDGQPMGVEPVVIRSSRETLLAESGHLLPELRSLVAIGR